LISWFYVQQDESLTTVDCRKELNAFKGTSGFLTPRYSHQCQTVASYNADDSLNFLVDVYRGGKFIGNGVILDEDFVSTSASLFMRY
jgi:hypothetical protein